MSEKTSIQKREADSLQSTERTRSGKVFLPAVDIYETGEEILLLADMPGVDEKSIDITLDQDVLTLEGRVSFEPPKGYELSYGEYEIGDYHRSFTLNDTIDRDKIEAKYQNGVLEVHLPKVEPAKPKKIEVKTN